MDRIIILSIRELNKKNSGNARIKNRRVVVVDDDSIWLDYLTGEIELRGIELRHLFEADGCLRSSGLPKSIDLFLVDVMLPSEFRYPIDYSRYTGVFLARDIRKYHQAVPIVLLSNHSMPDAVARIQKALASIGNCAFVSKQRFKTALDFGDIIEAILADGVGALKRGFWKRLGAGVLIQPNFAGVGVDLREVFDV